MKHTFLHRWFAGAVLASLLVMPIAPALATDEEPNTPANPTSTSTTDWTGNGTNDSYCSDLRLVEEPIDGQRWHFVLTSPDPGPWTLTAEFDPATNPNPITVSGTQAGKGAVHFYVNSAYGAQLLSASSSPGGNNLVVSHCDYNEQLPQYLPLVVEKTAVTSYTRTWDWTIEKVGKIDGQEVTDLGNFVSGDSETVNYTVKVSASSTDSDWVVSGTITVTNPLANNEAAEVTGVEDLLNGSTPVTNITCSDSAGEITFPYSLGAGASFTCDYSYEFASEQDALGLAYNIATATTADESNIPGADSEEVPVTFGEPTTLVNECVLVNDTNPHGPQNEQVCAEDLDENGEYTFNYSVSFGFETQADVQLVCGKNTYTNTATVNALGTRDEEQNYVAGDLLDSADWTVTGFVTCFCSYSQGYWFAKPNNPWPDTNNDDYGQLTIGGKHYTWQEGKNIFFSSNKGGITDAKKAFLQLAALKLSFYYKGWAFPPAALASHVTTIETFLAGPTIPKITGNNVKVKNAAVSAAAGWIGNWIDANHCSEENPI